MGLREPAYCSHFGTTGCFVIFERIAAGAIIWLDLNVNSSEEAG